MKTLTELSKEQGAISIIDSGDLPVETGGIFFENEAQLKATINAYNAQRNEPYGYVDIKYIGDGYRLIYVDDNVNSRYTNDRFLPLYLAPQTIPPETAEYIERLERALLDAQESINRFVSDEGSTQKDFDTADHVMKAWVIEFPVNGGSLYFCGSFCLGTSQSAIRFSRQEDAQRVLNFLIASALIDKSKTHSVTEHMWMGE